MFFRVPLDRVVSIDNRFQLAANIPIEKIGHCPKLVEVINPIVLDFRYDIGLNFYMSLTSLVLTAICSFVLLLPKFGIVFCCGHVGKNRNQDKLQDAKNDSESFLVQIEGREQCEDQKGQHQRGGDPASGRKHFLDLVDWTHQKER